MSEKTEGTTPTGAGSTTTTTTTTTTAAPLDGERRRGDAVATGGPVDPSFPVVGVGASAGGLEAFTQLLEQLPPDTGMAFVLVQHLDPKQPSLLASALSSATKMPVAQATDGERIEPDHVYVIPPGEEISIRRGRVALLPRAKGRELHLPIDSFLRSLAEERGSRAIGVILSGTASDGTEGLRAIKGADGITLAQEPASAKFDGMPRSAVEAGVVDYCLPIPELALELIRLGQHPYVNETREDPSATDAAVLPQIVALVKTTVGVDFSEYKSPTFERRLARRMALRNVDALADYLALLHSDPKEVRHLYDDTLIHVTSFFRDPEVFDSLTEHVYPAIMRLKAAGDPIRMWVAGCSTGEEVYSLAITLLEFLGEDAGRNPIQLFGSDVSDRAIEKARLGCFLDGAMGGVSDERRARYFTKADVGWRINKSVRDLCVFSRHDLARDPPFSKLDLVSCRNVLIYFGQALQQRILPMFHYALSQGGFLLLGRTESVSGFARLFCPLGKSTKVFARTQAASKLQFAPRAETLPAGAEHLLRGAAEAPRRSGDLARQLDRMFLARYSPPGVVVNARMDVVQFRGDTGMYLKHAPGEPQINLVKMARAGLVVALRAAIAQAERAMAPIRSEGIVVDPHGHAKTCDLVVIPLKAHASDKEGLFVIVFEEPAAEVAGTRGRATATTKATARPATETEQRRIVKLEHELAATEDYLQSLIDEQARTNEDLNSANEELVSGNEELQSMNEELETAKEELQSTNEELVTVNDELHNRNLEAAEINSDLLNLLTTIDVPILILDVNRRIRRFNPKARSILSIVASDVGRPFGDFKSNLKADDLDDLIAEVIESNAMHEQEVQDREGHWYRMQIRPYKTIDNKIDGATVSLVDIDALRKHVDDAQRARAEAEQARAEAERANRAKDEFLATVSHEIRTPLFSMLMNAELLQGDLPPARVRLAGEVIERGVKLQVQLIDDLLDVARIVAGKLKIDFRPVDLGVVINAALESVSAPAAKKRIELAVELDPAIGTVRGDLTRLQQVVVNLLSNAIKFSSPSGRVSVVLDRADGHARIRVSDTGSGIEPEFLPHVFNRFAQEDASTVRRHGGLGLGLGIVHHLVEAHGGTIHAASAGRGQGASFSVLLPLMRGLVDETAAAREIPREPPSDHEREPASSRGVLDDLRILVVDDDLATRDVVASMLGETGASVRVAESAVEAMTVVEAFRPEVLLCDIAMPGEDGYSLIKRVRDLDPARGGGDIPALALTAFASEDDRCRALAAGFRMHLAKPVTMVRLAQAVAELSNRPSPTPPSSLPA